MIWRGRSERSKKFWLGRLQHDAAGRLKYRTVVLVILIAAGRLDLKRRGRFLIAQFGRGKILEHHD